MLLCCHLRVRSIRAAPVLHLRPSPSEPPPLVRVLLLLGPRLFVGTPLPSIPRTLVLTAFAKGTWRCRSLRPESSHLLTLHVACSQLGLRSVRGNSTNLPRRSLALSHYAPSRVPYKCLSLPLRHSLPTHTHLTPNLPPWGAIDACQSTRRGALKTSLIPSSLASPNNLLPISPTYMLSSLPFSSSIVFDRLCYRLGFNSTCQASRT